MEKHGIIVGIIGLLVLAFFGKLNPTMMIIGGVCGFAFGAVYYSSRLRGS
jgi:hypothetical protein